MPLRNVNEPTLIKSDQRFGNAQNGKNKTGSHLSTNIIIFATSASGEVIPVGAVKTLALIEARAVKPVSEVGSDGLIDVAPQSSATITGNCTRTRFNGRRIAEALGRGFVHIKSQRTPFNIEIHDNFRGDDATIVTVVENVWFTNLQYNYNSESFIIEDTIQFTAEDIYSRLGGSNAPGLFNPALAEYNQFEKSADLGQYRGALDGSGLLTAFDTGVE